MRQVILTVQLGSFCAVTYAVSQASPLDRLDNDYLLDGNLPDEYSVDVSGASELIET
jgi:hypothetical protein